jgi:hypothetical protein
MYRAGEQPRFTEGDIRMSDAQLLADIAEYYKQEITSPALHEALEAAFRAGQRCLASPEELQAAAKLRAVIIQLEKLLENNTAKWGIEPGLLDPAHTAHFYAVKGDRGGQPVIVAAGRGMGVDIVQLIVQANNHLPELIHYARRALEKINGQKFDGAA